MLGRQMGESTCQSAWHSLPEADLVTPYNHNEIFPSSPMIEYWSSDTLFPHKIEFQSPRPLPTKSNYPSPVIKFNFWPIPPPPYNLKCNSPQCILIIQHIIDCKQS